MKKFLLLMIMCIPTMLFAQNGNGVTVSGLVVTAGTVTFNVSWAKEGMPDVWLDSVWVFVDYNKNGVMTRLPLTAGATLTATSPGGKVIAVPGNNQGVWVVGNARTNISFSATVRLLTSEKNVAGACVYASNYPPVGKYDSPSMMSFTGTPEFKVVMKRSSGSTYIATVDKNQSLLISGGDAVLSFTDKTGAPGTFTCIPMTGSIGFSLPAIVSKGVAASFEATTSNLTVPNAGVITYTWSAPGFMPSTYSGTIYTPTAPANSGTFPVTLIAHSEGYCDLVDERGVEVLDCINPGVQSLLASASSFCAGATVGVTFALSGTDKGANYQLYRDGNVIASSLVGTGGAATFSGTFNVAGTYTVRTVAAGQYCGVIAMSGSRTVAAIPLPAPVVATTATLCYGLSGQLQAVAPAGATIEWYNVSTKGVALHTGSVLPLTPLYNNEVSQYYAQSAILAVGCVSAGRTQADYVVRNCAMGEDCPGFTAGSLGTATTPAACSAFYPGQIGAADYPAACVLFDAGRIGKQK
jgi:hypothetical protein